MKFSTVIALATSAAALPQVRQVVDTENSQDCQTCKQGNCEEYENFVNAALTYVAEDGGKTCNGRQCEQCEDCYSDDEQTEDTPNTQSKRDTDNTDDDCCGCECECDCFEVDCCGGFCCDEDDEGEEPVVTGIVEPIVTEVVEPVVTEVVEPVVTEVVEPVVTEVVEPAVTEVVEPVVTEVDEPVATEVAAPVVEETIPEVLKRAAKKFSNKVPNYFENNKILDVLGAGEKAAEVVPAQTKSSTEALLEASEKTLPKSN